jgi:hypothetical protein
MGLRFKQKKSRYFDSNCLHMEGESPPNNGIISNYMEEIVT